MLSCNALLLALEAKLGFPGVKLEALVEGDVLSDDSSGGAGSWATVQTAVVWHDVVLGKTPGNVAINTVAEEEVCASGGVTLDITLAGSLEELGLEGGGVLTKSGDILGHEGGHDTSDVRASHGSTREEVDDSVASGPGAENLLTGSVDVYALTNVGEGRDLVVDVDRADSDDVGVLATEVSRGATASVNTVVTGGNRNVDASL